MRHPERIEYFSTNKFLIWAVYTYYIYAKIPISLICYILHYILKKYIFGFILIFRVHSYTSIVIKLIILIMMNLFHLKSDFPT